MNRKVPRRISHAGNFLLVANTKLIYTVIVKLVSKHQVPI